jgi:hypothetical protein
VRIDVTDDVNGAEDIFGVGLYLCCVLDDHFCGAGKLVTAKLIEAGGPGVAIETLPVIEMKFVDDGLGVAPAEEGSFDFFPVAVIADDAFAGVAFGRGGHGAGQPVVESSTAAIGDVSIFALRNTHPQS